MAEATIFGRLYHDLIAAGWSFGDIAEGYGVSAEHVVEEARKYQEAVGL